MMCTQCREYVPGYWRQCSGGCSWPPDIPRRPPPPPVHKWFGQPPPDGGRVAKQLRGKPEAGFTIEFNTIYDAKLFWGDPVTSVLLILDLDPDPNPNPVSDPTECAKTLAKRQS